MAYVCPNCGKKITKIPTNKVVNENYTCRACGIAWLIVEIGEAE